MQGVSRLRRYETRSRVVIFLTLFGAVPLDLGRAWLFADGTVPKAIIGFVGLIYLNFLSRDRSLPAPCEEASMKTLYELLGVSPQASDEDLKKAYRELAKMHHPDLNPNEPNAARRFREVTVAIAILRDAKRRSAYNQRLVRELQRRLDREREWHQRRLDRDREWRRLQWPRIAATSAFSAVLIGIVVTNGSAWVGLISSTSVVDSGTTYGVVRQSFRVSTAQQETVSQDRSNDKIQPLPAAAPQPQTSSNGQSEVSAQSAQYCEHETEPHCDLPKGSEADERGLSANEQAVLIRQAQELLASGDAKNAGVMLQRACQNSKSRCDVSFREYR
jgi:hypothetical protein